MNLAGQSVYHIPNGYLALQRLCLVTNSTCDFYGESICSGGAWSIQLVDGTISPLHFDDDGFLLDSNCSLQCTHGWFSVSVKQLGYGWGSPILKPQFGSQVLRVETH